MPVFKDTIKHRKRDFVPPAAVLVLGTVLAIAVFVTVRGFYIDADRQQFQRDAGYYSASFRTSVERHVASLTAMRAFVSASHDVSRWEFSTFAKQTLPRNSGFKAVLWLPHVGAAQRKTFERNMQRDGLFGLQLRELTATDALVKAGTRPAYLPVAFVEPFEGSSGLIGVDLSNSPLYAPLFEAARKSGGVTVSPPMSRALVETSGPVVAVVFPLSRKSGALGLAAAPHPEGYVLGVLQLDRVIRDSLGDHPALQAGIALGASADARMAVASDGNDAGLERWYGDSEFHQVVPFEIAGKRFFLALRSGNQRDLLTRLYVPAEAALLVIALAALLAQSMLTTVLRKREVERAVIARTAELRALNEDLRREVEQRRLAETQLRIAKEKAESANRAKSVFLSTMSHELRTPLNAIIGFSSILRGASHLDHNTSDYMTEINDSGLKLLELINDILEIAQMDTAESHTAEPIDVADIARGVIAAMEPLARKSEVVLRCKLEDGLPRVLGDGKRVRKAVHNLLSNAVKFTPAGGWAEVSAHGAPDGVVVEIRDSGVGMAVDTNRFDIFTQGDSSLARKHEGVGLGLTYVKRVADQHDAKLEITSALGMGTCVQLVFPAQAIDKAIEAVRDVA